MKYVEVLKRDRGEVESLLRSPNPNDVMDGLLGAAYHDTDWKWVQGQRLAHLAHNERSVRRLSATCLGHVARIHKQLDLELVLPRLLHLKDDTMLEATYRMLSTTSVSISDFSKSHG